MPGKTFVKPLPPGVFDTYVRASNAHCYAIGSYLNNGHFKVRRIVWGRLMARAEKRPGEKIRKSAIYLAQEPRGDKQRIRRAVRAKPSVDPAVVSG